MPSFDRWIWLLKRTVQRNNWSHLHEGFLTDESYLRELANMIDYVNDESKNVLPNHKVRVSILHNKNPLYEFRQNFAVAMYKSCLLYTSPSPRDRQKSRMPSSA